MPTSSASRRMPGGSGVELRSLGSGGDQTEGEWTPACALPPGFRRCRPDSCGSTGRRPPPPAAASAVTDVSDRSPGGGKEQSDGDRNKELRPRRCASARSVAGRWRGNGRRAAALSGCLLLLVLVAALVAASSFAGTSANSLDKVDPAVVKAVDGGGETTFWAVLHQQADLHAAPGMNRSARGKFVYDRLNSVANESQAGLRSLLEQQSASFKPFWVVNAIRIRGDATLLQTVAARPEVAEVIATRTYKIPKPVPGTGQAAVDAVEWGIDRIRADEVWSTFGDRGEGIVVANIDTGVQFDHPALRRAVPRQPGRRHASTTTTTGSTPRASAAPVARPVRQQRPRHPHDGHDGRRRRRPANQIGVAPHAQLDRGQGLRDEHLLGLRRCSPPASGSWRRPTSTGQNPRPDLRPHIVNNSWGGGGGRPVLPGHRRRLGRRRASSPPSRTATPARAAASSGSPGDYPQQLQRRRLRHQQRHRQLLEPRPVGLRRRDQAEHRRAGRERPQQRADERATPLQRHVDGLAARGRHRRADVVGRTGARSATSPRRGRCSTAPPSTPRDLTCGGTAADNNVWGEGRLDAFAAVDHVAARPDRHADRARSRTRAPATRSPGRPVHASGPVDADDDHERGRRATASRCRSARTTSPRAPFGFATETAPADGHRGRDDHAGLRARAGAVARGLRPRPRRRRQPARRTRR